MSNIMQLTNTTGIVILAFAIGVIVGRIGAYTMGMKFGMKYAIEQTYLNFCKIFKKYGIYDLFREVMDKEAKEQGWSNNNQ